MPWMSKVELYAAIVDRLTFSNTIFETGTGPRCLPSSRVRVEEPAKAG
ncbi:ATPase [Streptomyces sp. NPDC088090]